MRAMVAVLLLVAFFGWGAYYVIWAYQSASFSVAADMPMKAEYETRAMLAFPTGVLLIATGIVSGWIVWSRRRQ